MRADIDRPAQFEPHLVVLKMFFGYVDEKPTKCTWGQISPVGYIFQGNRQVIIFENIRKYAFEPLLIFGALRI